LLEVGKFLIQPAQLVLQGLAVDILDIFVDFVHFQRLFLLCLLQWLKKTVHLCCSLVSNP